MLGVKPPSQVYPEGPVALDALDVAVLREQAWLEGLQLFVNVEIFLFYFFSKVGESWFIPTPLNT